MKENMGAREDGIPSLVVKTESDVPPSWVRQIASQIKQIESELEGKESVKDKEKDVRKKHSIYKVPDRLVGDKQRVQLYEPQVVSLGPYHHEKEQLQAMEKHKERALCHASIRTWTSVEEYWKALKEENVLQQLMDTYEDLDPSWKDNKEEFLKMMIVDGCFMLEVMRVVTTNDFSDYAPDDPIFSYHGMLSNLSRMKRDMLMLENQIPLLVLHKLFAVEIGLIDEQDKRKQWLQQVVHEEVNYIVLSFFKQEKTPRKLKYRLFLRRMQLRFFAARASTDDHEVGGLHVLDVLRKSMIKEVECWRRSLEDIRTDCGDVIWHATQLEDAGIRFKRNDSPSLKDITFQIGFLHATLRLPQLRVDNATESKFLNLIAFEHLHTGSGKEVSSYVSFMSRIIKSDKDVSLLSENNIIKNFVGTDQAVADLFNGISHAVSIDPDTDLGRVNLEVFAYCNDHFNKQRPNKHLVELKRSYFKSPWTFMSLTAAILLLSLTIIQSVYTILQYYKPN